MNWARLKSWARGVVCSLGVVGAAAGEPPVEPSASGSVQPGETVSDDSADAESAVLYTIGAGTTTFERWGHSLICFQPASAFSEDGSLSSPETPDTEALIDTSCFDFGIFPAASLTKTVLGTLRGEPLFVPQEMAYQNAVGRYWWLDRTVERQVLPLSSDQVFDLRDRLNNDVLLASGYSYHPFYNNCSSQLRDVIDEATGGELGRDPRGDGPSFREIAERGFSGHVLALAGLQVLIGGTADMTTSSWERAAFPEGLKGLVARRLGVKGHIVYHQTWSPLPTSVHAGRGLLVLLSLGLCASLLLAHKREGVGSVRWRKNVGVVCGVISGVGSVALLLRLLSGYPEFSSSFAPLILFPLDAALPWMSRRVRRRYIVGRLAVVGALVGLSLLHVLSQPLALVGMFAALPLGFIGLLEFRSEAKGSGAGQGSSRDSARAPENV